MATKGQLVKSKSFLESVFKSSSKKQTVTALKDSSLTDLRTLCRLIKSVTERSIPLCKSRHRQRLADFKLQIRHIVANLTSLVKQNKDTLLLLLVELAPILRYFVMPLFYTDCIPASEPVASSQEARSSIKNEPPQEADED